MHKKAPKKLRVADHGLVHGYIGDGKGKTTAAVGTSVRAVGYGWKVLYLQFMKSAAWRSGERDSLKQLGVVVRVMGEGFYKIIDDHKDPKQHKAAAQHALAAAEEAICSGEYQLVVLDELGSAVDEKLLSKKEVEGMLKKHRQDKRGKMVHVIWTGHSKVSWMVKDADLVTEMKMVKHPYYRGIIATKGLDY